ncbi:hypothetical protein JD844_019580 [Phrynosoma platyrhinos]|uniref:Transmembrane protein 114 n=1 Tax=Phrynosoma platyrhinos TaxID=52577 RepID=A0ABQ7TQR4_PHRPL|nr:hypothetical protein JD844_019580 [Phrynosoma platyrhinos]
MKLTLNMVSFFAALVGILSFIFLVAAIGTDFWYLIDASKLEKLTNSTNSLSSHSGLWRTCQFKTTCLPFVNPFKPETENITTSHKQLLNFEKNQSSLGPYEENIEVIEDPVCQQQCRQAVMIA